MATEIDDTIVEMLVHALDIPDSAYEAATRRYKDLGKWLHRSPNSESAKFGPEVSSQGSFRLGTTNKPRNSEDYDLDMACTLTHKMGTEDVTQFQLKQILGRDLDRYRKERGLKDPLDEKHRCWRLIYQDEMNFHMDVVPGVPADAVTQRVVKSRMLTAGQREDLSGQIVAHAVSITDNRHPEYKVTSPDWLISNPEGFAIWFESRMRLANRLLLKRAATESVASIDELSTYRWKTPLQRSVQILKRHRDIEFQDDPNSKPASVILTTLAAQAYNGEDDVPTALGSILDRMGDYVLDKRPRVPNPVNPAEDFADRWCTEVGRCLGLEDRFWAWLEQAKADFTNLKQSRDPGFIVRKASQQYGVRLNEDKLSRMLGSAVVSTAPTVHAIKEGAPKPWRRS